MFKDPADAKGWNEEQEAIIESPGVGLPESDSELVRPLRKPLGVSMELIHILKVRGPS